MENSERVTDSTIEDLYADGAYQSPDNREFAKNHNAMQLKTGKMQSGLSYFHSNLIILANCKK